LSYIPNPQSSQVLSHSFSRCARAVAGRLRGPGGYYNVGNLLGLVVTLAAPFAVGVQAGTAPGGLDIVIVNFAGSPSAVALTSATAIFLVSGEMYHRAGTGRSIPDATHNRFADALSAIGSLVLTISLLFTGQWGLAIASGLLTVLGKLGSALFGDDGSRPGFWPTAWVDPFRGAVLVGRAAGVMAAALDFGFRVVNWSESSLLSLIQSGTLVVCYLLWVRADLLLAIGARVRENEM
jgi:hypothetical protein